MSADLNPERLRRAAMIALEEFPLWQQDQIVAAIHDGRYELLDLGDDWIACHVLGVKLFAAHRSAVTGPC